MTSWITLSPSGNEQEQKKEELWRDLQTQVAQCTRCPLASTRTRTVFGEGPRNTAILFIGEGPGADEDASGKPFVGKAGQLLTKILEAAGIPRQDVFITNVVKCRPPGNRVPTLEETFACDRFLQTQIALVSPRILICLGNTPTKWILKTSEGITKTRGKWFNWKGISVMPMFHPSYLLRYQSSTVGSPKHLTWTDIQAVKEKWLALEKGGVAEDA
jgi:DNA polymerase